MLLAGLSGHGGRGEGSGFLAHGQLHACCLVSRLLPPKTMQVTFDPHPAPLLMTCGPSPCVPLCQVDLGSALSCLPPRKSSRVYNAFVPQVCFLLGVLFLCAGKGPISRPVGWRGGGAFSRHQTLLGGGRNLGLPGRLPLSGFRFGCPVPPALTDSAPGSQAEPERERWRRPGTCRATFVLGADCDRRAATPSGPGRKGARACARPWKPRLLPVPASESQETKSRTEG